MSTYIPASLKEAHDRFETAQQEYYVAYEKAHPDFVKARTAVSYTHLRAVL